MFKCTNALYTSDYETDLIAKKTPMQLFMNMDTLSHIYHTCQINIQVTQFKILLFLSFFSVMICRLRIQMQIWGADWVKQKVSLFIEDVCKAQKEKTKSSTPHVQEDMGEDCKCINKRQKDTEVKRIHTDTLRGNQGNRKHLGGQTQLKTIKTIRWEVKLDTRHSCVEISL